MSLIYILLEDGQQATYEEAEVRELLGQQALSPQTPFWKEGMADWRPLAELFPSSDPAFVPARRTQGADSNFENWVQAIKPESADKGRPVLPAPVSEEGDDGEPLRKRRRVGRYYFRTNPIPLTICLQIGLVVVIVAAAILGYQCLDKINGWSGVSNGDPMSELLGKVQAPGSHVAGVPEGEMVPMYYFLASVVGLWLMNDILFYFWIFDTSKNSRAFATNMIYTPGWAVAYFFIPILNLFRPYQVVQEIWKISDNPKGWIGRRDSIFVGLWFVVRLSSAILWRGPFGTSYSDSDDPSVRSIGTLIYMVTVQADLILISLLTLILISVITWRQARWVRISNAKD